jgi:hypothetical protein
MRISIWTQFSSNHSSSFTVVGEFQSETEAKLAADELRRLVQAIADYYAAHPEVEELWNSEGTVPPTPPEVEMAEQYQLPINHEFGIDWIWSNMPIDEAVIQLDKAVFVTHPGDTWYGAHPFDYILKTLGGKVMIAGMQDSGPDHEEPACSTWIKQLTCIAPDESLAQAMVHDIEQFQQESRQAWQSGGKTSIPDAPWQPAGVQRFVKDASTGSGHVENHGAEVVFTNWSFHKLAYGLPALMSYLIQKGCTNIQYELDSAVEDDD